jgi:uncharacterized protein (TIRG00374 family)
LKKTVIQALKFSAFLVLGLSLLYLAFRNITFSELRTELKEADYRWLILALLISGLGTLSRARRWVLLIRSLGYQPGLATTFHSTMSGYLANMALPRMGEITRCVMLSRREKIPVDKLVGTVILERMVDLISLFVIMIAVLIIGYDKIGSFFEEKVLGPLATRIMTMTGSSLAFPLLLTGIIILFAVILYSLRNRIASSGIYIKIRAFFKGVGQGFKSFGQLDSKWEFLFHSVFIWVCYILMTWVVVFVIPSTSHLTLFDGTVILVIGGFGMAAPVQSGLGAFHYMVSNGLLLIYNIPLEKGMAYALISHTSQMLFIAVLGSVSMIILLSGIRKAGK